MIHRTLLIGQWSVDVFINDNGDRTDFGPVTDCLFKMGASDSVIEKAERMMDSGRPNEAFTCSMGNHSCIYIGQTTSGEEFINSLIHELRHLIDHIANHYGITDGETVGYMSGDAAMLLAKDICELGCPRCGKEEK